ncbi:MAG: coproporphyrinogen III oxidase, partial [Lachnospiraceae bacterium]|nr:coproporphyrinogen III oxidase [Lachnospiraceae bacterium]
IPEQTVTSYEKTCEKVLALEPEHISAYSLIIEEGTPFYERYKDYPPVDEETDRLLYMKTKEILGSAGYERYEISNYAKPGYECIHNLKYWSRDEYLGLGLGASSLIGRCRLKNPSIMAEYLKKNEGLSRYSKDTDYYEEALRLEKEDEMSEFMFLGLRMMKGVSKHKFHMLFGQKIKDVYPGVCKKLIRDGLLTECDEFYVLTERGIDISNYVMSQFLL